MLCVLALAACGDDATPADTDGGTGSGGETTQGGSTTTPAGCGDPLALECPAPIEVACEGPQTMVDVPAPELTCPEWIVEGDAPSSYPVGTTPVTFTVSDGAMEASCTTEVAVVDDVPPEIECPPPAILVRASDGAVVQAPNATATDACDEAPVVTASAGELPPGFTAVTYSASDASGNEASCTADFGVIDAFAVPGFRILSASLVDGQTEVTLAWEPPAGNHVDTLRIETSDAEDGPWNAIDTVASTEQLFTLPMNADAAWFRVVSVAAEGDGGATSSRRAFRIAPELYQLDDVPVPGIPFATTLYGVVRHPTALSEGPFPFVLMLHGNHGNCRDTPTADDDYCVTGNDHECSDPGAATMPNAEGYTYLLETLAAHGFVTVSISANALNCRDDFILERSALIVEHLRQWNAWSSGGGGPFGGTFVGAIDTGRVGLMGHSRGGDAIAHVHEVLEQAPIAGLTVRSLFAVAPTDYHQAVIPEAELAVLLPSCDGDVAPLHGKNHFDRALAFDDGAHRAQVFYIGGNHNFFNTEWKLSEWELFGFGDPFCMPDDEALKREQTAMLEGVLGSWFWTSLGEESEPEPFVRADAPSPTAFDLWADAPLELRWSYSSSNRALIDDFSAAGAPAINALGEVNTFENWYLFEACFANACDPYFLHERNVVRLLWEQGNVPLATFWLGGYDTGDFGTLSFRVVSRRSTLNDGLDTQDFVVRLRDTGGNEVSFLLSEWKTLSHLYPHSNPVEVLETVRLTLPEIAALEPTLDLGALESLQLEMTALDRSGSVIVADIELAD
jgi:hypothetical protein